MGIYFKDKYGNILIRPKNYSATDEQVQAAIDKRIEDGTITSGGTSSGDTGDTKVGQLPYTINEKGLYIISNKNTTISTGEGAVDLINFNDVTKTKLEIQSYPTYNSVKEYTIIGDNTLQFYRDTSDKNCVINFEVLQLTPNTEYTLVAKAVTTGSFSSEKFIRWADGAIQMSIKRDDYVFKSFLTDENGKMEGYIMALNGNIGDSATFELHLYAGNLTQLPAGITFDILANEKYPVDGFLGATLSATTAGAIVNVYRTNSIGGNILFFGDSILEYSDVVERYAKITGKSVLNCAVGGTRLSGSRDSSNEFYPYDMTQIADSIASGDFSAQVNGKKNKNFALLNSESINNYDTIVLEFGTNDFTAGAPFNGEGRETIEGALRYILDTIQSNYKSIRIVILSTLQYVTLGQGSESGVPTHNDGTVWQMNEIIRNVCEEDAYCVPWIDMYHKIQENPTTRNTITSDGVHLMSTIGQKRYADILTGQLNALGI